MELNQGQKLFLLSMRHALAGEKLDTDRQWSTADWEALYRLAGEQNLTAMVYETVSATDSFQKQPPQLQGMFRQQAFGRIVGQVRQTAEFLKLYKNLADRGYHPLVVKGIICRNLYPNPDSRPSGDEDLFVPEEDVAAYQKLLPEYGLFMPEQTKRSQEVSYELLYMERNGALTIELHKTLFDPDTPAFAHLNQFFSLGFAHAVTEVIDGVPVCTLDYSQHLFFLIMHAYKHFLSGGFGLRQVCDMLMFAKAYGDRIRWKKLYQICRRYQVEVFAASLFEIGFRYLGFVPQNLSFPPEWRRRAADPSHLLMDLLDAGVFGFSDINRKHSSNMTISRVNADREGKKSNALLSVLQTAFPPAKTIAGRYPYLIRHPVLLPFAWTNRMLTYLKARKNPASDKDISKTIEIGNQRIALMKEYKIMR